MPSYPASVSPDVDTGISPDIGDLAPAVSLRNADGTSVALQDFRGEPLIVAFFGNDWEPARAEHLARYQELLTELLPSQDSSHSSREETSAAPLLIVRPQETEVARRFGIAGEREQAVFVIGGDGVICWKYVAPQGVYPKPEAVRDALMGALGKPEGTARPGTGLNRRDFLATALGAALLLTVLPNSGNAANQGRQNLAASATVPVTLNVNGKTQTLNLEPRVTLLDALREYMGLTGSKKGCDHGQCGACTVHVAGRRINSCLTLAVMHQNKPITTIEGLADGERLHPLQQAFIKHDGFQCGYCTPGQIMSAAGLLSEGHALSMADVREGMSGNICRCGAYPNIVAAVEEVRTGQAIPATAVAAPKGDDHATI